MARVVLKLLGGFEVQRDSGESVDVPGRKAQALLAFLALPPGVAHPRDKLAALLWPEIESAHARANLRLNLFTLRRALAFADPLRLDGDTVALDPDAVDVDAVALQRAVTAENPDAIAAALADYRGDLLAGLRTQEASFEEWLLVERERLREHAMDGWTRLLAHQRAAGDASAAAQTALRLLAMDPLQEPVHRALMRLYAALGRRGDALRQYQSCVSALKDELGFRSGRSSSTGCRCAGPAPGGATTRAPRSSGTTAARWTAGRRGTPAPASARRSTAWRPSSSPGLRPG
jgi:DNA-binding SARP family transcriptional activator